jgi:protein SCO1/2
MRLRHFLPLLLWLPLLQLLSATRHVLAAPAPDLNGIAYEQRPGSQLPGQAVFQDDTGRIVQQADLFHGKPLIIALGYFHCPNLCSIVRADLLKALGASGLVAGSGYSLILLSIDPSETSTDAAAAKADDLQRYPAPGAAQYWHFLTGTQDAVQAMADALGFHNRIDPERKTFAHPVGVVFATPAGLVSSYLLGVGYQPADVRLAVTRATSGGISPAVSPVLLLCFDYDPATGRYTLTILKLLRLAAAITAIALAIKLLFAFLHERRA